MHKFINFSGILSEEVLMSLTVMTINESTLFANGCALFLLGMIEVVLIFKSSTIHLVL